MDEAQAAEQLELAVAGDQDALQRLIVHYHGPLRHKLAGRMDDAVRRQVEVDDILQDAYVAAFRALAAQNRDRERAAGDVAAGGSPAGQSPDRERPADQSPDRQRGVDQSPDRQGAASEVAAGGSPAEHTPRGTAVPAVSSPSQDTADTAVPPIGRPAFDSPAGFHKWLEKIAFNRLRDQQRALHRQKTRYHP